MFLQCPMNHERIHRSTRVGSNIQIIYVVIVWEFEIRVGRSRLALIVVFPGDWMGFAGCCDPEHEFEWFAAVVEEEVVNDRGANAVAFALQIPVYSR